LSLPYNHRIPFARYIARSGVTNIKRYWIGTVYSEKLKLTSLHPREHIEASFDIVTSERTDCLAEIELFTVVNDLISSFKELSPTLQNYLLVFNHSYILNSIFLYCGVSEDHQVLIYKILADYNNKLAKSMDVSKENRLNWLKERLRNLNLNESVIEKLLNYLIKYGDPEKILSELRSLTKNESSQFSKFAKEALSQLKLIISGLDIIGLKIQIIFSCSFVMPLVSLPYEYDGFIFQLLVRRKSNKNEYDILASGGRYDKMINKFRNKNLCQQHAVGISFDFERICFLVNEKPKLSSYRSDLVVCCVADTSNQNPLNNYNQIENNISISRSDAFAIKKSSNIDNSLNMNSLIMQELKNRLRLFSHLSTLNKTLNVSTHMVHKKFQVNV
jgi:histidyl-tRNA synthetase